MRVRLLGSGDIKPYKVLMLTLLTQGVQCPAVCTPTLLTPTPPGGPPRPPTASQWAPSTSPPLTTPSSPPRAPPATPRTCGARWRTTPGDTDTSDTPTHILVKQIYNTYNLKSDF